MINLKKKYFLNSQRAIRVFQFELVRVESDKNIFLFSYFI